MYLLAFDVYALKTDILFYFIFLKTDILKLTNFYMENTIWSVWQIESNLFKNLSQLFIIMGTRY